MPDTVNGQRLPRKVSSPRRRHDLSRDDLRSSATSWTVARVVPSPDQFAEPTWAEKYPRDAGFRPPTSDNRLNVRYWRCSIEGATSGALAGKKIASKENVCVAGIPMMKGSNVLEGYVPDVDATIVTRILDAGGRSSAPGLLLVTPAAPPSFSRCSPETDGLDPRQPAGLRTEAYTSSSPETNALTTRSTPYRMRKAQLVRQMSNGPLKLKA
ncbi:hypothetical protein V1290_002833 [Bradyrhizobium sp. AZCC 1578]|uniref:amidase family protein n=1 Tax=Bradyrhizobium sp. AZCC 1578 TaxID=3117027 RepID=UPI002FEF1F11